MAGNGEIEMLDQLNEIIERFLVGLGLALNSLSDQETGMVSMFLVGLVVAAVAARALRFAVVGH